MEISAQLTQPCTFNLGSSHFIFQDWAIMREEIKTDCGKTEADYPDERSEEIPSVSNCYP